MLAPRTILACSLTLVTLLVIAAPLSARPVFRVHDTAFTNGDSIPECAELTTERFVNRIGRWNVRTAPSFARAKVRFGEPSSARYLDSGSTLIATWNGSRGMQLSFGDYSGTHTDASYQVQYGSLTGSAWTSWRGLRNHARLRRLKALHEDATRHGRTWWLGRHCNYYGTASIERSVWAKVKRGRVRSFGFYVGAAGE